MSYPVFSYRSVDGEHWSQIVLVHRRKMRILILVEVMGLSFGVVSNLWLLRYLWNYADARRPYLLVLRNVVVGSNAELREKVVEVDVCNLVELVNIGVPSRVLHLACRGCPLQLVKVFNTIVTIFFCLLLDLLYQIIDLHVAIDVVWSWRIPS
jgi:hypothetical protein